MTTLSDVAVEAGVSTTTVSHVVNGTRFVAPETAERVQRAIERLGYQVDYVARSLSGKPTRSVGLLVADITASFFTAIARAVEDTAAAAGYTTILCNTDDDPEEELSYLRMLRSKRVDGIILAPSGTRHRYVERLGQASFPLVAFDRTLPGIACDVLLVDNEQAAYQATSHLLGLGHRRIGVVAGPTTTETAPARLAGYRRALREHGVPEDPGLVREGDYRPTGGEARTIELLALPDPPTALFVTNQLMVLGSLMALRTRGVRVPDGVAFVGFDDSDWARVYGLTCVAQPDFEIGRLAAEMLIERIERRVSGGARRVELATKFIVRESCGSRRKGGGPPRAELTVTSSRSR